MLSSSNSTRIKKKTACGCILIYIVYFKPSSPIHGGGGRGGMCLMCGEVALIKIKNRISLMQDMLRLAQNTEKTDT